MEQVTAFAWNEFWTLLLQWCIFCFITGIFIVGLFTGNGKGN